MKHYQCIIITSYNISFLNFWLKVERYYLHVSSSIRCYQAIKFPSISRRSHVDSVSLSISNCNILLPVKDYTFWNKNIFLKNSDFNIRCPFKAFLLYPNKTESFSWFESFNQFSFLNQLLREKCSNVTHFISFLFRENDANQNIKSKQLLCAFCNNPFIIWKFCTLLKLQKLLLLFISVFIILKPFRLFIY